MERPESNPVSQEKTRHHDSQKEREALRSTIPSDEELVALHKKLMNTEKMSLDEKYDIAKKLLDGYDVKEKELKAYRRRSPEDAKKYEDQYLPTHALREMYAGMLKRIQLAIIVKTSHSETSTRTLETLAYVPAKVLLDLADKLQKKPASLDLMYQEWEKIST